MQGLLDVVDPDGPGLLVDGEDRGDEGADEFPVDTVVDAERFCLDVRLVQDVGEGDGQLVTGIVGESVPDGQEDTVTQEPVHEPSVSGQAAPRDLIWAAS